MSPVFLDAPTRLLSSEIINNNTFIFIFRKSRSPGKRSSRSPSRSPGRSTFGSDENDRVNNNNDAVGNNGEPKTFPEN